MLKLHASGTPKSIYIGKVNEAWLEILYLSKSIYLSINIWPWSTCLLRETIIQQLILITCLLHPKVSWKCLSCRHSLWFPTSYIFFRLCLINHWDCVILETKFINILKIICNKANVTRECDKGKGNFMSLK